MIILSERFSDNFITGIYRKDGEKWMAKKADAAMGRQLCKMHGFYLEKERYGRFYFHETEEGRYDSFIEISLPDAC